MAKTHTLRYLTRAALSAPQGLVNSYIATRKPIRPTVLICICR
jgi:hypothetical protein